MKLLSLKIENFRQFYGEQELLRFPRSPESSVILVYGANGAGKTTILNALTWALYEETTPGLENPDNLVCEKAVEESDVGTDVEASVTLRFEHEGEEYLATRVRRERKKNGPLGTKILDSGQLKLRIKNETGNTRTPDNPNDTLSQVLPKGLYNFFFFDGERIKNLSSGGENIGKAIKHLLGLTLLERAETHLDKHVRRDLEKELDEISTEEMQNITNTIQKKEESIEAAEEKIDDFQANLDAVEDELDATKEKLLGLEETQDLQEQLNDLEDQHDDHLDDLAAIRKEIRNHISKNGFLTFLKPVLDANEEILEEKRQKGEIPSGIKVQFVEDLLEVGECICGGSLAEGTDRRGEVEGWLDRAGLDEIEEAATKVGVQLSGFDERRIEFSKDLHDLRKRESRFKGRLDSVREKISEITKQLDDKESEDVQALTQKQKDLKDEREELSTEIGRLKERIELWEEQTKDLEKERKDLELESEREKLLQKRLRVCEEARDFFGELTELRSTEIRESLNRRVKKVYDKISYKPYEPHIDERYNLLLEKDVAGEEDEVSQDVAKSTGENQILSLSFIGSIADYARSVHEKHRKRPGASLGFEGGVYPIVMDSPLGQLDYGYQKAVGQGMPELADQVVLIVSKSQGNETVLNELEPYIDRQYVLSFYTTKEKVQVEDLERGGKSLPYIAKSTDGTEWAEIREVK